MKAIAVEFPGRAGLIFRQTLKLHHAAGEVEPVGIVERETEILPA